MEIIGEIVMKNYSQGSKSERVAIMLHYNNQDILLRRKDGNPFYDEVLHEMVGKRILCKGDLTDWGIIMESWEEIS